MKFSDDRISNWAHLICKELQNRNLAVFSDPSRAVLEVKKIFVGYFRVENEVDGFVRNKIGSLKRNVVEGSPEWDVLYRKYFEEEMNKRGR